MQGVQRAMRIALTREEERLETEWVQRLVPNNLDERNIPGWRPLGYTSWVADLEDNIHFLCSSVIRRCLALEGVPGDSPVSRTPIIRRSSNMAAFIVVSSSRINISGFGGGFR